MKVNPRILYSPYATKPLRNWIWGMLMCLSKMEGNKCACILTNDWYRQSIPNPKQTDQRKVETDVLATRKTINAIIKKENSSIQLYLVLWHLATGQGIQFQHRKLPAPSIQDCPMLSECTFLLKEPQGSCRSPNHNRAHWYKYWNFRNLRI
jgi:hypothetical protein